MASTSQNAKALLTMLTRLTRKQSDLGKRETGQER